MTKVRIKWEVFVGALLAVLLCLALVQIAPNPNHVYAAGPNNTVYLNGQTGNDKSDGTTAEKAVKTLNQAKNLVADNGTIYVNGTVAIAGDVTSKATIKRASGFTGDFVYGRRKPSRNVERYHH